MQSSRSSSKVAAVHLLSAVVAVNALWRGGVYWQAQAATAACLVAALLQLLRSSRGRRPEDAPRPARLPPLVLGLAAVTLWVALQLLPLPPPLLALLSPGSAELQRAALAPFGDAFSWRPLTLDPGATALELAKLAAWTVAAAAAAQLAASRERREQLLRAIALSGVAVAVACYGAALAGLGRLTESQVVFVNPNHLASFMLLTCWCSLGFGLRTRGAARVAWIAGFVAGASQVFLSLSRAGIAAFFVGGGVSVLLAIRSGHAARAVAGLAEPARRQWLRSFAGPVAITAALAVSAWLALDRVVGELRTLGEIDTDVKLSLWPLALQALRDHPLAGVGRGAFATVFPAYKVELAQVTFTHLENTWLQIPLDVGLPAGLALLALLGWTWLAGARQPDLSRPMVGALSGAAAVAAHDLFDFSLELNGLAVPFLMVLALAAGEVAALRRPKWTLRLAGVVALGLAALGFALHLPHRADPQAARVSAAETTAEALEAARPAVLWHPTDWIAPAILGARLVDDGRCHEAMEWLNRAMLRNPTAPQPHRSAARCLAVSGQDAAAKREYRLAFSYGDASALREAFDMFGDSAVLLQVAPDTPAGLAMASRLLMELVPERPEEAQEAYRRAWDSFHLPWALAGLARATMAVGDADAALEMARQLEQEQPAEPTGYIVAAEALGRLDRPDEAIQELEKGSALLPKRSELLFALGNRHMAARRFSQAKLVFEKVIAREGRELAQKRLSITRALEAQGRLAEALHEARSAQESLPGEPGPLLAVARIAEKSSLFEIAIDAVERAARLPQSIPGSYDDHLARLRLARDTQRVRWIDKQVKP